MRYKIEKGVPMPEGRFKPKYQEIVDVMGTLKPGESVLLQLDSLVVRNLAVRHMGKGNYMTRMEDGGVRLWRC